MPLLNVAPGDVIGNCHRKHRAIEFKKFLPIIDKAVPEKLEVHLVLDNYGTHETAMIHRYEFETCIQLQRGSPMTIGEFSPC